MINIYIYIMNPKCLTLEQMNSLLHSEIKDNSGKGFQSYITFYKISKKEIDFIKNELNIDIGSDIIVKKKFKDVNHFASNKFGGKNGQYDREKRVLSLLQNEPHFPTILSLDDNETTIYMSYCGNRMKKKDIPNNWKEQITEILSTLEKNKIYSNDMWYQNYLISHGVIHLVDFGWATIDKEGYPFMNITEKDLQENDNLLKLLSIIVDRVKERRNSKTFTQ